MIYKGFQVIYNTTQTRNKEMLVKSKLQKQENKKQN